MIHVSVDFTVTSRSKQRNAGRGLANLALYTTGRGGRLCIVTDNTSVDHAPGLPRPRIREHGAFRFGGRLHSPTSTSMPTPTDSRPVPPPVRVRALDSWDATDSIPAVAERVAAAALAAARGGAAVEISLVGLRAVSSTFANVVLQVIAEQHGVEAINSRFTFVTDTPTQREVLASSLAALLAAPR